MTYSLLTGLASHREELIAARAARARPAEIPAATTRRTRKRTSRASTSYAPWRRWTAPPELH
jgi:hypothetical protein